MKKLLKQLICLVMAICILFGGIALGVGELIANAEAYSGTCGDNLVWCFDDLTGILTINGTGDMYDYTTYSSVPWYDICTSIKTVSINCGVTGIAKFSFFGCHNLMSIIMPDSIRYIGINAFEGCRKLTDVYYIGDVGSWCEIRFDSSPFSLYAENLYINGDLLNGDIVIPEGVTSINACAFNYISSITSVTIPTSVTKIGDHAFQGCTSLERVIIGDGVKSIGLSAFEDCEKLNSIIIPESVTDIGEWAFSQCGNIKELILRNGLESIGMGAFCGCVSLVNITIPYTVKKISFYACDSLAYIYYTGTESEWQSISFGEEDNLYIANATIHYNSRIYDVCYSANGGDLKLIANQQKIGTVDTQLTSVIPENSFMVTFDANGGQAKTTSKTVDSTFKSWNTAQDGSKTSYQPGDAYTADKDVTLYAQWDDSKMGTLEIPTREGYYFDGWYTDPYEGTKVTETSTISSDMILYAHWIELEVTGMKWVAKPAKTEYIVGEVLATEGAEIAATFNSGETQIIPLDEIEFYPTEFDRAGKKIVKASYGGKYVSFIVNVSNKTLTSVSVTTLPDKLTYTVGEALDTSGLVLKTVYDDSSSKTVTQGFIATCNLSSAGTKTVNVEYTENGVTVSTSYQITVNPKTAEPDAVISVGSVSATAGERISVPFRVEKNKGFMGFAITVDYDSAAFTPVAVTPGAMLGAGTLNDSIGTAYEYLKIVFVASDDIRADGDLFTVDFIVNENAFGDYSFEVSYLQPDTFNESLDDVIFKCNGFDATVSNAAIEQSVVFAGGSVDAESGTTVSVPVSVENGIGIESFLFRMSFNSEVMSFVSTSSGNAVSGKINTSVNESTDEISLSWSGSPIASDGVLFYVTFEIEDFVQSAEILSVLCENVAFANGSTKDIICIDAEVNITNPDGGDTPVIYSVDYLRIEDSIIEVPVYIKNNHGVMGFGINFEYDSSVITPLKVTSGNILSGGYFVDNIGSKNGSFKVLWNHSENIIGNGLLFTLRFSVADGANPLNLPLSITYSKPDTYNEDWEDVALNINIPQIAISYVFTATFMHNGEIIGTDEFFPDDESLDCPVMPTKPHYEWVWDEYELIAEDITVEGRYVPIEYTISYCSDNIIVATDKYTVETSFDEIVLPKVPEKIGYTGKWNEFSLGSGDITVYCDYTPIVYTASFYCDGSLLSEQKFTVETSKEEISLPDVPSKNGYSGKWDDFTIAAENLMIHYRYTPIVYTAIFVDGNKLIGTYNFTIEDEFLEYPEMEKREHYEWVWDEHKIEARHITIKGRYVPVAYTINFVSNGKTVKTQEYNIETVDSIAAPEFSLPYKEHYTSAWEKWEGKIGNITVNEIYILRNYYVNFYCKSKPIASRSFTIEDDLNSIVVPEVPELDGYIVNWPEINLEYKDQDIYAVCTPIVYTAQFIADGRLIATRTFTVETEKLDEPAVPQKAGYIASWDGYAIKAENMVIHAKYRSPEVIMKSKITLKTDETTRLLTSCNFEVTEKSWTSSNPAVATVDKHGNVTAVGKGECKITVTCYGKDSFGNDIKASNKTKIVVKEELNAETLKERFRAAFDEFFQVKLHDILHNFREFMMILFRYAY